MIKFKCFLVFGVITTFFMSAQTSYKVLYNDGNVFLRDSLVEKGQFITESESNLNFKNNKGLLKVCYSSCTKIKIISGNLYLKNNSKSIQDYTIYYESLSTRGGSFLDIEKLKSLDSKIKIAIVDTLKIPLNYIESDSNNIYFAKVKKRGETYINELKIVNEELIITKDTFFTKRKNNSLTNKDSISIYRFNKLKKENTTITSNFKYQFINKKGFKKDFKQFLKGFETDDSMKSILIRDYFKAYYPNTRISKNELLKLL